MPFPLGICCDLRVNEFKRSNLPSVEITNNPTIVVIASIQSGLAKDFVSHEPCSVTIVAELNLV